MKAKRSWFVNVSSVRSPTTAFNKAFSWAQFLTCPQISETRRQGILKHVLNIGRFWVTLRIKPNKYSSTPVSPESDLLTAVSLGLIKPVLKGWPAIFRMSRSFGHQRIHVTPKSRHRRENWSAQGPGWTEAGNGSNALKLPMENIPTEKLEKAALAHMAH